MGYLNHETADGLGAAIDVTLDVGTGAGRKAVAFHVHQNFASTSQGTAIRDPSSAAQSLTNVRHEDVLLSGDSYFMLDAYYLDLDGIEGSQTFRFDATGRQLTSAAVVVWDELAAGAPEAHSATEFTTATDTISNAVTTVTNGAIVFSGAFFRSLFVEAPFWTANNGQTKRLDVVSNEIVPYVVGDLVAGSAGSQTVGWTGDENGDVGIQVLMAFEAASGGDTDPPTLTSPTATATGQTTASGSVSTDEANGTLYAVVTTSATPPSDTQVAAGQDHTGAAAADAASQAVSGTGVQNISGGFTGLTAATYYAHYMHEDAAENRSTVVSSSSFTTDAIPTLEADGADLVMQGADVTLTLVSEGSISSVVTLGGDPVEGATVRLWDITANASAGSTLTDENGGYTFADLQLSHEYHASVEYRVGETLYNAPSQPFLRPVAD